ncbi:protein-L-isoaspartate(D-aspartate) O-methyltransferase [Roseimicrobium gellanilyticum]|uniref:Protein-L-isoaspartate O-methyltransferase n=2 Tax=Roseimicrobium gellanilyticum TaxID=748857 RepID=A0A366HPV0_9BACT|nr:protein-L-isoaspartate(D-aspartate) O-methyltransferase [Roseimicrobium gellanilyticum]
MLEPFVAWLLCVSPVWNPNTRCCGVSKGGIMSAFPERRGHLWFSLMLPLLFACILPVACSQGDHRRADRDWDTMREEMVKNQIEGLGRDISDKRVLAAMRSVPRHEFVPEAQRGEAYADTALPIGHGQTISQPYIVAFMTEKLLAKPEDRVLEIGTGSGYQAAILAKIVKEVYTIEIVEALGKQAASDLKRLGFTNVKTRIGDGYVGWPEAAPFDSIIVTCAPDKIPKPLVDQLKEGGRMIIPVGPERGRQNLYLMQKTDGKVTPVAVLPVRFVPMTGEAGR